MRLGVTRMRLVACTVALLVSMVAVGSAEANHAGNLHADQIQVNHFAQIESGLLGIGTHVPISVHDVPHVVDEHGAEDYAHTVSSDASGGHVGRETHCSITFAAAAHQDATELADTAAHEVFHCLSAQIAGTIATFSAHGEWLSEGAAAWVESDLVSNDTEAQKLWVTYLNTPNKPLFSRDYDAIGFFGHLAAAGLDPWKRFAAMFSAPSDPAAYLASGGGGPDALDSEASAFFGDPTLGDDWTAYHQGNPIADDNVPHIHRVGKTISVTNGNTTNLSAPPYTDLAVRLLAAAPVTMILAAGGGQVRLHSTEGPELNSQKITTLTLCRDGAACTCPSGSVSEAHEFKVGDLAISGGPSGEQVTIMASCDLPAQPCQALNLDAYFLAPYPAYYDPDQVTQVAASYSGDGFESGTGCTVQALNTAVLGSCTPSPSCAEQPLGLYGVASFDSATDASKGLAQIEQQAFTALGNTTSPADAGDEAFTSSAGGGVRVDNLVFYFRWLPLTPPEEGIDPASVLQSVAATLQAGT